MILIEDYIWLRRAGLKRRCAAQYALRRRFKHLLNYVKRIIP